MIDRRIFCLSWVALWCVRGILAILLGYVASRSRVIGAQGHLRRLPLATCNLGDPEVDFDTQKPV